MILFISLDIIYQTVRITLFILCIFILSGVERSLAVCLEREAGLVEDKYCDRATKPNDRGRPCNEHMCPARYVA